MIKINLATRKQSSVSSDNKGGRYDATSVIRRIDLDQLKDLPFKKLIAPLLIGFAATYWLETFKENTLSGYNAYLGRINSENAKLQADLNKFKSYDSIKKSLDEDESVIKAKLETVKTLIADRSVIVKILVSFSSTIPKDVWLSECKIGKTEVRLKGNSLGLSQISDFMKGLRDINYFSTVELVDTLQSKDRSGIELANFELNIKRR